MTLGEQVGRGTNPDNTLPRVRDVVRAMHETPGLILRDEVLDRLLGIPSFQGFESGKNGEYNQVNGERGSYLGTPYYIIKEAIQQMDPTEHDVVYDLGSGFGRFVLYGALATDAQYVGVELLPHRVQRANKAAEALEATNARSLSRNVRDMSLTDGTCFYMFHPFVQETLGIVMEKLDGAAKAHPIKVATLWMDDIIDFERLGLREQYRGKGVFENLAVYGPMSG